MMTPHKRDTRIDHQRRQRILDNTLHGATAGWVVEFFSFHRNALHVLSVWTHAGVHWRKRGVVVYGCCLLLFCLYSFESMD